jgi:tape measure domain-containing protein
VAVATVDIRVNSQGAVSSIRNVNAAASQLESQINNTNRSVKQLETAFAGLGVAVAGMNALNIAKDFFATANAADTAQRRIKLVSAGLDDYRVVLQTARNAATKFGLSQTEAANAVADIYTRLRPVGYGLSSINAIYEGFNTAVKLSGVEAGAASAAFLQLSQGLGSGTLQGDELRSILEQMPSIAQAIAKEMDINVGSIKKFGSEGKITADVIVRALDRIRTDGTDKLAVAMDTPQQKIVALGNAMEDFKVAVTSDVAPVVIGAIGQITVAIQSATQFVADLKTGFGLLASAFSGIGAGISSINTALSGTIGKFAALGQSKGLMMMLNFLTLGGAGALSQLAAAGAKKNASKPFAAPIGPEMPVRLEMQGLDFGAAGKKGKGKGKSAEERAADKAARDAARLAEQTKTQLDAAYKLNALAAANLDIQVSMNNAERLKGEFDKAGIERRMQFLELQKNAKSQQERELLLSAQLTEIQIANNKYAKDKKTLLDQQLKPLEDIITANKTKLEDDKAYQRLVAEGINPELAKQYIQIDRAGKALQEALQPAIDLAKVAVVEAEARGASADEVARLRKELEGLQQLPGQKAEEARKGAEAANKPKTFQEGIAGERDKVKKDLKELTNLTNVVNFGAKTIGDSFAASFKGIISGTMGAKEALASFFQSVADAFLDMAAQIIAKWIQMTILNSVLSIFPGGGAGSGGGFGAGGAGFGGSNAFGSFDAGGGLAFGGGFSLLPGRALGGSVSAGSSYMVGERGPELFTPKHGGNIVPNNAIGCGSTSVVVNVDASGNSNVQGDQAQSRQLGIAVSAAVQAELVKQQRPGGLLAGTRR